MNDTAAELGNQTNSIFSNTSPGVVILLAIVALLMVVTIVGLIYGAHQKRRRVHAETEVVEHAEEERKATGDEPATAPTEDGAEAPRSDEAENAPPPPPPPPPAEPVAPAPPAADEPSAPGAMLADEPIPATDFATANPAAEAEAGTEAADDTTMADAPVTILKGLGPKVAARLGELGVTTVGDLAALDDRAAQDLDARLGAFTGRMTRDRWLEQARLLAAGDRKGFEERFGKLER